MSHHWSGAGAVHPVLACLATATSAVAEVADLDVAFLSAGDKRAALLQASTLITMAEELRLRVLAAGESLGDVADEDGSSSAAAWLAANGRLDTGRARHLARLALALGRYAVLAAAVRTGAVDIAQAEVIAAALDALPGDVAADVKLMAEERLVVEAKTFAPMELRRLGKRILDVVAPDVAQAEEARQLADEDNKAKATTFLRFRKRGDGTTDIYGRLSDAVALRLQRYLQAWTNPRKSPADTPSTDPVGTSGRGDTNRSGTTGRAATSPSGTAGRAATSPSGTAGRAATSPDQQAASDHTSRPPQPGHPDQPGPAPATSGERRPYDQKMGEAFGAFLEAADPDRMPLHGGDATTVVVTIDLDTLRNQLATAGVALMGDEPITAAHARRLACTAGIVPAVLDGESHVLDLGRTRRLYNPPQRKALAIRYPYCAAHGCDIPAPWCEAHHAGDPWSKGGRTDLADGVLLCSHHHHVAHDPRYDTTRHPDGSVRFHKRVWPGLGRPEGCSAGSTAGRERLWPMMTT